jgi:hypothetical protein
MVELARHAGGDRDLDGGRRVATRSTWDIDDGAVGQRVLDRR